MFASYFAYFGNKANIQTVLLVKCGRNSPVFPRTNKRERGYLYESRTIYNFFNITLGSDERVTSRAHLQTRYFLRRRDKGKLLHIETNFLGQALRILTNPDLLDKLLKMGLVFWTEVKGPRSRRFLYCATILLVFKLVKLSSLH